MVSPLSTWAAGRNFSQGRVCSRLPRATAAHAATRGRRSSVLVSIQVPALPLSEELPGEAHILVVKTHSQAPRDSPGMPVSGLSAREGTSGPPPRTPLNAAQHLETFSKMREIVQGPFFSSSAVVGVSVLYMWRQTMLLPHGPEEQNVWTLLCQSPEEGQAWQDPWSGDINATPTHPCPTHIQAFHLQG